jgi:NADH:ubiquinone oxidoreductase subunit 5 (subunit L)/multisubunit Na+/H+ antiporter MnhA subunit
MGDLFRLQPFATVSCILGYIALVGTPFFPLFLSKFGILIEAGRISLLLPMAALVLFAVAAVALFRFLLNVLGEVFEEGSLPEQYSAPAWMRAPIIILLLVSIFAGILMIPGEEAFLLAAVKDLGITGGI